MTISSGLRSLPNELLLEALVHLDNTDLNRIRLVCAQLNSISLDEHGKRCFSYLSVAHHEQSVTRIQQIAKHTRLNNYVRKITIRDGHSDPDAAPHTLECCAKWQSGLISAMECFPHLQEVAIDNVSRYSEGDNTDLLRCRQASSDAGEEPRFWRADCSCLFSGGLVEYERFQKLKLSLWITGERGRQPYNDLLDPKSQPWKNLACKLTFLRLEVFQDNNQDWNKDLLCSAQNLEHLIIVGDNVPDSTWPKLLWPALHTVELMDLTMTDDGPFINFIDRHNATIVSLALMNIELIDCTWEESLHKVFGLKQLSHVHLFYLTQARSSTEIPSSVERVCALMEQGVDLCDRDKVNTAAKVFRSHCWTSKTIGELGEYFVDWRVVRAVLEGRIGYEKLCLTNERIVGSAVGRI